MAAETVLCDASIHPLPRVRSSHWKRSAMTLRAGSIPMVTPSPPAPVFDVALPHPATAMTIEDVRRNGWIIYMPSIVVHWCGHGQEVLPIPGEDGRCDLVPVIGEAW